MAERKFLLDTNILSTLIRDPAGEIASRIAQAGEASICTSIVVAAELRYGAHKSGSSRLKRQLEVVLAAMDVLPLEPSADLFYGKLRVALESRGEPIGPNDMLIAAQALAEGITVVTANEREFRRVRGLKVQNWLA